ncbi:hypothetical protein P152DRAFT_467879 [Eremomyces bilateralis CBS 781.70]|uniref:Poly A polymerase head domain-containing protein n=1 Tax=Eremomyces bilateralis CBS 781.70 TaxID=1392243 RepID=A0A6G1FXW0_9PEZI|nr:uncharacterized protein P152DRAFT_467879 [Eremomyces bilateralis CBS 781.70]KAF1810506.1 hypothetical protein P152DRAFT_467879 [Eremomyces bilateralis CBS 781.70]
MTSRRDLEIKLTEVESTLARFFLDVAQHIDQNPSGEVPHAKATDDPTILRFTGGWVRDKLLGVASHDIDVAVNNMTGYQFGLVMNQYLDIPGKSEKYGLQGLAGKLHKIAANPEKSKHLETTTTRVFGLDIDIVNLRKETYAEDSRNPQMEFGTPEDDALRRDATVNALFYNLNTSKVEDYTGRGLNDMEKKLIRTPLEPYQTFNDDPLRVLRLIRFASRLDYAIIPEVLEAMADESIKAALRLKISRERVGVEIEKMLKGPRPLMALSLIHRLGLYGTIFTDPTITPSWRPDTQRWDSVYNFVSSLLLSDADEKLISLRSILIQNEEDGFLAWVLACTVPYLDAPEPAANKKGNNPSHPGVSALREGIKAPNKVSEVTAIAYQNRSAIKDYKDGLFMQLRNPASRKSTTDFAARDVLGLAIRRWGFTWRSQVLFSMLDEIHSGTRSIATIVSSYEAFVKHVESLDLLDAYALKPIINGKALMQALGGKSGPWLRGALDTVMAYQLRNPGNADASAAIDEIKAARSRDERETRNEANSGELTRSLIHHFLRLTIRSSFEKHLAPEVTSDGRKKPSNAIRSSNDYIDEEKEKNLKPWKHGDGLALELLIWSAKSIRSQWVQDNWGLLIPPILTLLDDHDTGYKIIGCDCLRHVLEVTPSLHLQQTNLANLFEEKLLTCFYYLPTSISVEDSSRTLAAATAAMVQLIRSRWAIVAKPDMDRRVQALDKLLRQGILRPLELAGDNAAFAAVLFQNMASILDEMEILSVKHMQNVLDPICGTLRDPFLHAHPPLAIATLEALRSLMRNAWPRIIPHRQQIIRGLTRCWVTLCEDSQQPFSNESELNAARLECKEAWEMLSAITMHGGVDIEDEIHEMVEADLRLGGLFQRKV